MRVRKRPAAVQPKEIQTRRMCACVNSGTSKAVCLWFCTYVSVLAAIPMWTTRTLSLSHALSLSACVCICVGLRCCTCLLACLCALYLARWIECRISFFSAVVVFHVPMITLTESAERARKVHVCVFSHARAYIFLFGWVHRCAQAIYTRIHTHCSRSRDDERNAQKSMSKTNAA